MNSEIHHPEPVRASNKRLFSQLEPEDVPANKHPRLSPFPSPSPSVQDEPANVSEPSCRSSSAPPQPKSSSKRTHEDLASNYASSIKLRRLQFPSSADNIDTWISDISNTSTDRSQSCPPAIGASASSIVKDNYRPVSLATIQEMSQQALYAPSLGPGSSLSQSGKPGTSHFLYRASLYHNFISMDPSGRKIPAQLKTFTNDILKRRASLQLDDDSVSNVIDEAEDLADSPEAPTLKLLRTAMFPLQRSGIAEGGNTPWNITALPRNLNFRYALSAPKADAWLGYTSNEQKAGWTDEQSDVLSHPTARPYISPAKGGTFPGFMIEMKADSTSGSFWHAENQAAGSGTHSVNAMVWLLNEARLPESSLLMDTISFSAAVSHRQAIIFVHWYCEANRRFYMSYLKSYSTMEPEDIRSCNNTVKNIIDYLLDTRKTKICNALQALFPVPDHWESVKRRASTTADRSCSERTNLSKQVRRS